MNLEAYRVFYEVARVGQISQAARNLYVSQPAVSQTIKHLEAQLKCPLLYRTPKGVVPTYEGQLLFSHLKSAFKYIEDAQKSIEAAQNLTLGEIRIGTSDSICGHYLLEKLAHYQGAYPQIKVHVHNQTSQDSLALLAAGDIDLAFVNTPIALDHDFSSLEVMPLQDIFVCSPLAPQGKLAQTTEPVSLRSIANEPLIVLERGAQMRAFLDGIFAKENLTYTPAYELGSSDLLARFAAHQFGVAFVTRQYVQSDLASGLLVEIPIETLIPSRSIAMVRLNSRPLNYATASFFDLCNI